MSVYYNELDPEKAAWIRELIKADVIAPGEVDERSISDVQPDDLRGFKQCHFFAGIGVWSYALRLAGWPDDKPVWTGSCPCPSFSCAGKGTGFDDPRHLWPVWYPLIRERRPGTVFGEQSDDAIGFGWLDLVSGEMEAAGYAIAAAVLGAHSAGAPHIRQRLYFVGERTDTDGWNAGNGDVQRSRKQRLLTEDGGTGERGQSAGGRCTPGRTGAAVHRQEPCGEAERSGDALSRPNTVGDGQNSNIGGRPAGSCAAGTHTPEIFAGQPDETLSSHDPERTGLEGHFGDVKQWRGPGWLDPISARSVAATGATRGFWADCDWWYGRDGRYRPIKPGLFPLAHGVAARVLKLRGAGDAICAETAKAFIESYQDISR